MGLNANSRISRDHQDQAEMNKHRAKTKFRTFSIQIRLALLTPSLTIKIVSNNLKDHVLKVEKCLIFTT